INPDLAKKAASFIKHTEQPIEPRKQIATSNEEHAKTFTTYSFPRELNSLTAREGRVLSRWGDSGWGTLIKDGKERNYFSDELVDAVVDMIAQRWKPSPTPQWVCCVPSLNHKMLVPDFAARLANKLGIPFIDAVSKIKENQPQKFQNNRFHQCKNLDGAFKISSNIPNSPVLLIDDMVDSRWTFTVISALLRQHGSGDVFPVALASTSVNES
ncbi:MAG: ATP-dependent DNA helicase RecG, partial [Pseudomonadota bacterium]|nr:ATP-dependent DNA helicase RecG [Pseudomonadota bacterium]